MNNENDDVIDVEFTKVEAEPQLRARVLRTKMFLASTLGSIEYMFQEFLEEKNICVGNYVDVKLLKRGHIYQLIFIYAKVIDD